MGGREELEGGVKLLPGVRRVTLGPYRQELGQRVVVAPQDRRAIEEVQEQEFVEPAGDGAALVEELPEGVVQRGREHRVQVAEVPLAQPQAVRLRERAVGQL